MFVRYKFSDDEVKTLLKENLVILCDTREQVNQHILDFFDKNKINYKRRVIKEGDYTAIITKRPEMGILRDLHFNVAIERKNSIDELASNFSQKKDDKDDDIRIEREFKRAREKKTQMYLLIEDKNGRENIVSGKYRSQYKPQSFMAQLTSMEVNYLRSVIYTDKINSGWEIHRILKYSLMEALKDKSVDISAEEAES